MATVLSFDIGGTLLKCRGEGFCTFVSRKLGLPIEELRPQLVRHLLTKDMTMDQALCALCEEVEIGDSRKIAASYRATSPILFEDSMRCLNNARALGIPMITLSNCTPWEATGLQELGVVGLLEASFWSFQTGFAKPDRSAFAHVEQVLGLGSENFIHVGDSWTADVVAARECGWRAVFVDRTNSASHHSIQNVPIVQSLDDLLVALADQGWLSA